MIRRLSSVPATVGASGPNVAERIERDLTRAILRGDHRPGSRLPTLRELAAAYAVNPSTMQRALARIEARGLVTARQGSGLRVNDPADVADLTLVADWLAVSIDDPERATAIVSELAEVRRILVVRLVVRHRDRLLAILPDLIAQAGALAEPGRHGSWQENVEFEKTIARAFGNGIVLALQNSMARALEQQPLLVEAVYHERPDVAANLYAFLEALQEGGDDLAARLEAVMAHADAETVRRFRALLEQRALRARPAPVGRPGA